MILNTKRIGNKYSVNAESTCTKEEFKKALEDDKLSDLINHTVESIELVGFSLLENYNGVILEDSTGRLHVMTTGSLYRSSISNADMANLYSLKEVDLDVEITEPYGDEGFGEEFFNPRAQPYIDKMLEDDDKEELAELKKEKELLDLKNKIAELKAKLEATKE